MDPHLLVLALAVAGLNDELCGEDVGQLGPVAIAPASDLHAVPDVASSLTPTLPVRRPSTQSQLIARTACTSSYQSNGQLTAATELLMSVIS